MTSYEIEDIFKNVSGAALRHWLKINGHPHSATTNENLYERIAREISSDKIKPDDLLKVAITSEESASKRVFLFRIKPNNNFQQVVSNIENKGHVISDWRLGIEKPNDPKLNYIKIDREKNPQEIRIKFTETQTLVDYNIENDSTTREPVTKIIMFVLWPETNLLQIRFDHPTKLHDHKENGKSSRTAY